jgi:hypothetical protein
MRIKKIDFEVVREMALALPYVEQSTIHGAPSLKVRGKLLCCPALHSSAEPDSLAIRIDHGERAKLMEANPTVYYVTDHFLNYATVLVRLSRIDRNSLKKLLGISWNFVTGAKTPRNRAATRVKVRKRPNQSTDPTLLSGTSGAGQQARNLQRGSIQC